MPSSKSLDIKMDSAILSSIIKTVLKNNMDVYGLSETFIDSLPFFFKKKKMENETGIRVSASDDGYVIDLYLIVKYGVKIPELAWDLQTEIKYAVEKKFATKVSKVNIHIQGVIYDKTRSKGIPDENNLPDGK
ncbi:MAG: Asp23/Gls24 family envelope stress response protein [Clostridia bacterium]|nr:Asp23/Gls24 family envelope stress response protein [Clostridia bacterium]